MQLEVKINLILHATENENKILEILEDVFHIEQKNFRLSKFQVISIIPYYLFHPN